LTPTPSKLHNPISMEDKGLTSDLRELIRSAASLIRSSRYLTAFTGAGISVESGIPPFRGEGGLWNRYDPRLLELDYFLRHPEKSWPILREIFYEHFGKARPNKAHTVLARMENDGWPQPSKGRPQDGAEGGRARLRTLITQNIDNLHHDAGSRNVVEFHGSSRTLVCLECGARRKADPALLENLPPRCGCGGIYKPDFIFFGEGIPTKALIASEKAAGETDLMLVIGSTGEVYPAAGVPRKAKDRGAGIIEINPRPSEFTPLADLFIGMRAGEAFALIEEELYRPDFSGALPPAEA
jgi:NAD-dependent deacetylase